MPEQRPPQPAPNGSNTSYSSCSALGPQLEGISSGNHLDDTGNHPFNDESYHNLEDRLRDREDQYRHDEGELADRKSVV